MRPLTSTRTCDNCSAVAPRRGQCCVKGPLLAVDSHAHLDDFAFAGDRAAVVARALAAGVDGVLTVGVDAASSAHAVLIAQQFPGVHAAVGVHPSHAEQFNDESTDVYRLLEGPEICAVGEIGLDYYRCSAPRELQRHVFQTQLAWASEHDLPVIVHDREAHEDVLHCLRSMPVRGVLHCFSGDARLAARVLDLDMTLFVSLAGNVTYPRASGLQEVAREVPLEWLLVESDAPYLSPQPRRGDRNEPAYIQMTVSAIATLRELPATEVARATGANAARLFGWC